MRSRLALAVVLVLAGCGGKRAGGGASDAGGSRIVPPPADDSLARAPAAADPGYVGPEVCAECHAKRVESVKKTAHFRTTAPASRATVLAPLDATARVQAGDGLTLEAMEKDGALWQLAVDARRDARLSRRMDVVIGSGKIAQTFLSWEKDRLYELPMTWFAAVGWRQSPGYAADRADFSRTVTAQCLECHTLYAQAGQPQQVYDNSFVGRPVWGVTCEKCHGPGAAHVKWRRANPKAEGDERIVVPSDLPPERRDDVCLLCHAARADERAPAFTFRPGDELGEHYAPAPPAPVGATDTLHTFDQMDRLSLSRCWKGGDLHCISCHNPHVLERGEAAKFSQRCMVCHPAEQLARKPGNATHDGQTPCIDCHMPLRGTDAELLPDGTREPRARVRDHRVAIY